MKKDALVKNAADEEQIREGELRLRFGKREMEADLAHLLSQPQFRRYVWRHLTQCGIFRVSTSCDNYTFFREGERNIGLRLQAEIMEVSPDAYLLMMQEQKGIDYV